VNPKTLQAGDKLADTVAVITPAFGQWLKTNGYVGVMRYVDGLSATELSNILASGLACGFVTYAEEFNPAPRIAELKALGVPVGVHVFLDVEGCTLDATALIAAINTWSKAMQAAGYLPGLYVGAGALLSSDELYALVSVLYWHGCSRLRDRNNQTQDPACGWGLIQLYPGNIGTQAGVIVDISAVQQDYQGRLPILAGA
jgi:hypothetical protein